MPANPFKAALQDSTTLIGLWSTLGSALTTEILAGGGYDWLLLDTEHSPHDPITILPQLQVIAGFPAVAPVVRPAANDPVLIKRFLDIGATTLLIPYIQNSEEARAAVAATRYPPQGMRGVSALTRATGFGRHKNYFAHANHLQCVILQIETRAALDDLEAIAAVDGVDALFVGPADLAANLGFGAEQSHPEMRDLVIDTIRRIKSAGKPAGLLTADPVLQQRALDEGVAFMAVGVDAGLLRQSADDLLARVRVPGGGGHG